MVLPQAKSIGNKQPLHFPTMQAINNKNRNMVIEEHLMGTVLKALLLERIV
jgi:hypothetical protein